MRIRAVALLLATASLVAGCGVGSLDAGDRADRPGAPSDEASSAPTAGGLDVRTIAYGDHPEQVGDLYLPASGGAPFPVVVLVHGGFWREQYRRDLMEPLARDLVERGYAVWNIEYRRVGGDGGWPETLTDAAAAVDHLDDVDAPLDLGRVATVGHSAGGQLSFWLASRHRIGDGQPGAEPEVRPAFAVSQAGVVDLDAAAHERLGNGAVRVLLGGGAEEVPQRYAIADPSALVPIGVPTLAVHGRSDEVVPPSQSDKYVATAQEAGDLARLELVEGDHFTLIEPSSGAWRVVMDALGERLRGGAT